MNNGISSAQTDITPRFFHEIIIEMKRWIKQRGVETVEAIGNIYENPKKPPHNSPHNFWHT